MANSTWLQLTDEVLGLGRQRKIKLAADFDSDPSTLSAFQAACKAYIKYAHQFMSVRAKEWFSLRVIDLPIDSITADATFGLGTSFSVEALRPHSFFNVTQGGSNFGGPLPVWSQEQFDAYYPDKSIIPSGPPEFVVILESLLAESSPTGRVRIFPNPDGEYALQFRAHLNAYTLTEAEDLVLWPPEYEHVLTSFAWDLFERALGEGKEEPIRALAQKAAYDVQLVGTIPKDIRRGLKSFSMRSMRYGRRI